MHKGRLEAFTDGVMAIIITIMVLEMKVPEGATLEALVPIWQVFLSYILSFAYVGIYWMNHHNLLQACQRVNGHVLLANLNLLFWLSLLPFTTGWMGKNDFASTPVALYGLNLLLAAVSYNMLQSRIAAVHHAQGVFTNALGADWKGKGSILTYIAGTLLALAGYPFVALALLAGVALLWLVPDRRMEEVARTTRD
jgi:uncharacterized membrane protein